jgi:FMN reductase
MAQLRAVAISGSPRAPSKSKTLAEFLLRSLAADSIEAHLIDVASLPGEALLARTAAAEIDDALVAIGAAQIVIAASPTYRALYTGALKAFFDLMPQAHLRGKVCVPLLTAASPVHFLAIDHGFAPLFASLDGIAAPGVYATDDQFVEGVPSSAVVGRIEQVARVAASMARGALSD